jgi:hypothetical protein
LEAKVGKSWTVVPKSQAPSTKYQVNTKHQAPNSKQIQKIKKQNSKQFWI